MGPPTSDRCRFASSSSSALTRGTSLFAPLFRLVWTANCLAVLHCTRSLPYRKLTSEKISPGRAIKDSRRKDSLAATPPLFPGHSFFARLHVTWQEKVRKPVKTRTTRITIQRPR